MYRKISIPLILILAVIMVMTGCQSDAPNSNATTPDMRTIVDDAGRTHEIPTEIESVFSTGLMSSIYLYTLVPEKMIGWNNDLNESAFVYLPQEYIDLPVLGRWAGTSFTGNIEEILKLDPDVLINLGDINEEWIGISDAIQEELGIPVIMIDGSFNALSDAYKKGGDFLGAVNRGNALAEYAEGIQAEINTFKDAIASEEKLKVYLGSGQDALETSGKGSLNVELIELLGGEIVADGGSAGRFDTTIEQVIVWNPELIFLSDFSGIDQEVKKTVTAQDSVWQNVDAVKTGNLYTVPNLPFDWLNRPPSVMRLMGAQWLADVMYPDFVTWDVNARLVEFMDLFFGYELSPSDVENIIPE
ncbi:ABC transporter substrate-binding protein [Fusibacter tunisiensis]|uniref:Iron complex transport system substrate-binding protein n=1 Tax=Fusibacter tunisiensis TaxID=1008308 RepID=A0ABS2MSP9_9FIRM|nr:ABC transporter substrate-binding protein [Fusibacter tunisiensis]MBM7562446.1 iron complex transport system substrate-binding protein [Fusibacter tunisiensis]